MFRSYFIRQSWFFCQTLKKIQTFLCKIPTNLQKETSFEKWFIFINVKFRNNKVEIIKNLNIFCNQWDRQNSLDFHLCRHLTSIWKVNFVWKQHDQMIKENGSSICCALHIRQNNLNGSIDFMSKQKKAEQVPKSQTVAKTFWC